MITVYTTKTCAYCPMVKKYLTAKNIPFNSVDITEDLKTARELQEKTGLVTVPIVINDITGKFVAGWNIAKLNAII